MSLYSTAAHDSFSAVPTGSYTYCVCQKRPTIEAKETYYYGAVSAVPTCSYTYCVCVCVFITAVPITNTYELLRGTYLLEYILCVSKETYHRGKRDLP